MQNAAAKKTTSKKSARKPAPKKRKSETIKAVQDRVDAPVKRFTVEQVAATYHTTPRRVREWVRDGDIEAVKVGKRFFFTEKNLKDMEAGNPAYSKDELEVMSSRY